MNKNEFGRREFLQLAGSATAGTFLSVRGLPVGTFKTDQPQKVLVVGAGMAGLSAGYELSAAGHDVTILEAQLRPGGRVQTLREPFSDGLYAEAGAGRIPADHELTMKYVRLFDLPLEPFYPTTGLFINYLGGNRYKANPGENPNMSQAPGDFSPDERKLLAGGSLDEKYVNPYLKDIGDRHSPAWPPETARRYDQSTWDDFLRSNGASNSVIAWLDGAEDDSALDNLLDVANEGPVGKLFKIKGGNDLLPKAFASRLSERIWYGSPVVRIERNESGVRVTFVRNGTPQTLLGDHLICAIPFSVLRQIEISPLFSEARQQMIAELRYAPIVRVIFQTRKRYWEQEHCNGFASTDNLGEIWSPTFDQPGPRGLLVAFVDGPLSRRLTEMPADDRIKYVAEGMDKIHPGLPQFMEGATAKVWRDDPWARGGFAVFAPGQLTSWQPLMARSEGRIHFAGDHLSPWPGWIQGAIHSGLQAAALVISARN